MDFQEAMTKGFLNVSEKEASTLIDELFDNDDAAARFDAGLALLMTFVPEAKVGHVLDLCGVIMDAHEEMEVSSSGNGHDHDDHEGHDHS